MNLLNSNSNIVMWNQKEPYILIFKSINEKTQFMYTCNNMHVSKLEQVIDMFGFKCGMCIK